MKRRTDWRLGNTEREGINPSSVDSHGQLPLSWAAINGHKGIVKSLLGREEIDPNAADAKYGRAPLFWAARGGHGGIVELLL